MTVRRSQLSAALRCVAPREYTERILQKRRNDAIIIPEPVTLVQLLLGDMSNKDEISFLIFTSKSYKIWQRQKCMPV
ncbi:unnamed protein product [Larinioides sclopetarius]|uniref:Uncharacterized protein n=1 Tax=Larinioides sclopetarius TaxID=280406 RepID=A0AAV2B5N6_9ARAC